MIQQVHPFLVPESFLPLQADNIGTPRFHLNTDCACVGAQKWTWMTFAAALTVTGDTKEVDCLFLGF